MTLGQQLEEIQRRGAFGREIRGIVRPEDRQIWEWSGGPEFGTGNYGGVTIGPNASVTTGSTGGIHWCRIKY